MDKLNFKEKRKEKANESDKDFKITDETNTNIFNSNQQNQQAQTHAKAKAKAKAATTIKDKNNHSQSPGTVTVAGNVNKNPNLNQNPNLHPDPDPDQDQDQDQSFNLKPNDPNLSPRPPHTLTRRKNHVNKNNQNNVDNNDDNTNNGIISEKCNEFEEVDPPRNFFVSKKFFKVLLVFLFPLILICILIGIMGMSNNHLLKDNLNIKDLNLNLQSLNLALPTWAQMLLSDSQRPGLKLASEGFIAHHPVVFIPGIVSTGLELWKGEECARSLFRQRIWGSTVMIKTLLLDSSCWLKHMSLNQTTGLDPDGIKLRPALGLEAADYLVSGFWIWAKVIENLADIGYDSNNMIMAAYDWRLSYRDLQLRDFYFDKLKSQIELLKRANQNRKVVLVAHSMGGVVLNYFNKWVESSQGGEGGSSWVSDNIHAVVHIGSPLLGAAKTFSVLFSGEMKDTADLAPFLDYWRQRIVVSQHQVQTVMRSFKSLPSIMPKGGNSIWGDSNGSPSDLQCNPSYLRPQPQLSEEKVNLSTLSSALNEKPPHPAELSECCRTEYSSSSYSQRGAFISFTSTKNIDNNLANDNSLYNSSRYVRDSTVEEALNFLDEETINYLKEHNDNLHSQDQWFAHINQLYSFDISSSPELNEDQKYFSNPLAVVLPRASNLTYYCLYGVGSPTERGYVYSYNKNKVGNISYSIDTSITNLQLNIRNGVKYEDGDGTVPLVSLGYMCTGAWKSKKYNPSGSPVINREYFEFNKTLPILRASTSTDHVDIMGNNHLITDLIKILSIQKMPKTNNNVPLPSSSNNPYRPGPGPSPSPSRNPNPNGPNDEAADLHSDPGSNQVDESILMDSDDSSSSSNQLVYRYRLHDRIFSCIMQITDRINRNLGLQTDSSNK